ncbi:MAG: hypothetical protein GDA40_09745 [Rhodobacteraceae bacterium]|nr:hypothetical protein [Paracoccaceae bacterium]
MRALLVLLGLLAIIGGCTVPQPYADDDTIAAVSYRDSGRPSITVMTTRNISSGAGAHSALMINASERIIINPAGSFEPDFVPERNDTFFGITPYVETYYIAA